MKKKSLLDDPCPNLDKMPPLPSDYGGFFDECDRRAALGQTQLRCLTCKRYRWPDQRNACVDFTHDKEGDTP